MLFLVITFLVGLASAFVPIFLLRFLVKKWHIQPKIFWKAGLAGLMVSLLVFGVTLNIDGAFPAFDQLPVIIQALTLGFVNGLFIELGKFLVLDRFMHSIRSREAGMLFGFGWSGLSIIIMGFFLAVGVFGMYNLLTTKDLASTLPNADADQMQFLQESQKQIQDLVAGSPLNALTPLLESMGTLMIDMAMALLIILGLSQKKTRYVWFAVGIRTILATILFYVSQTDLIPVEIIFGAWMIVGGTLIFYLQKSLKHHVA